METPFIFLPDPANVKGGPGGGGGSNGGGGSGNGSDNGNGDHSRAQQLLSEHLLYVNQLHLTLVVSTINVTLPSLISFFTKHVLDASCGLGATLEDENTRMTTLPQEAYCALGERLRNRSLQHKRVSLITEEHTMLG